jgi:hypothetical protein
MTFHPVAANGITNATLIQPSGDTTGVTDATNITTAIAALPSKGGMVQLASTGQWYIKCGNLSVNRSGVYIHAPGVFINAVGTGDVIRMTDTGSGGTWPVYGGGITGNPVIDGTNAGAGSAGVHLGDLFQASLFVSVQNFFGAGSIGVHLDNANFWTEQLNARIYAQNCASGVVFDVTGALTSTASFARAIVEINIVQAGPTFDGVVLQNGAFIYDGIFDMGGNFASSGSVLTSAALRITGTVPAGHPGAGSFSGIDYSNVNIGVECASGAHTPFTMVFGNASNTFFSCYGVMDWNANFTPVASGSPVYPFNGITNGDANLATVNGYPFTTRWNLPGGMAVGNFAAGSVIGTGSAIATAGKGVARVTEAGAVTGIILNAGTYDGQIITVINESNQTITFAASGTSHVADGASDVIAGLTARTFVYDGTDTNLWYRSS